MKVGVPKETVRGERRVALVPDLVSKLDGIEVVVEQGAGAAASFTDEAFTEAGAAIGDPWAADLVAKVRKPSDDEVGKLRDGQVLIGFLQPLTDQAFADACHKTNPVPVTRDDLFRLYQEAM